jgi:MtN3 and saliva related transmembrane protein
MPVSVTIQIVGTAAAVASTISFAPQAWKIIRTRDVTGLSAPMYLITVSAFALWLSYGWLKSDWALIVPNALCFGLSGFILVMICLPKKNRQKVADAIEEPLRK